MFKSKTVTAVLLLVFTVVMAAAEARPKYVFLFVGDGMGPTIRQYYQKEFPDSSLEKFPVTQVTGTNNCQGKLTDSAASGTAIACGIKTYNGAVGVNADGKPVTSLAKILRDKGMAIGIITSVGLNDATPGAHYAHRLTRKDHVGVLSDLYASNFDFFAGGFLLKPNTYSTSDYSKLLNKVKYEFRGSYNFDKHKARKRVVYVAPMEPDWPEAPQKRHLLSEVTEFAIQTLQHDKQGFFMLIEGGAIDHRAHNNDLAGTMREMREFDLAVKSALKFQQQHPKETLIVITSDHDTGGMNIKNHQSGSLWKKQANRAIYADSKFKKRFKNKASDEELIKFLSQYFGLAELTLPEQKAMQEALRIYRDPELRKTQNYRSMYGSYNPVVVQMMRLRDARCGVDWTGFSHTDRKVWTNAQGAGEKYFKNIKENSDIPHAISLAVLGEDVMDKAAATPPQLVEKKMEEYFNFITINSHRAIFRYGQKKADPLELSFKGGSIEQTLKRSDRFGRVSFEKLTPDTEYTLTVKRNNKTVFERKIKTLPVIKGKMLGRIGLIADPHVALDPDTHYGRMHSQSVNALALVCKQLAAQKVDFIVLPGDITEASKYPELKAVAKVLNQNKNLKFYGIPGNHDRLKQKSFKELWIKTFGATARLEKHGDLQILLLDTGNGNLADKPENLQAVEALDPALPVVVFSHYQLAPDSYLQDPDRAIHDADKAGNALKKLASMQGIIFVGHKNVATSAKLGKLWQINLPQLTQFPAGVAYAEIYQHGCRLEFQTVLDEFYDEYGRIRGNAMGQKTTYRDRHSLKIWNNFYEFAPQEK
ncbi:MAG: hypothetical protein E7052_10395 [Lentisphaerae bacterium]|nr:hypothetical protein [Lentisphaerota bacterium]